MRGLAGTGDGALQVLLIRDVQVVIAEEVVEIVLRVALDGLHGDGAAHLHEHAGHERRAQVHAVLLLRGLWLAIERAAKRIALLPLASKVGLCRADLRHKACDQRLLQEQAQPDAHVGGLQRERVVVQGQQLGQRADGGAKISLQLIKDL